MNVIVYFRSFAAGLNSFKLNGLIASSLLGRTMQVSPLARLLVACVNRSHHLPDVWLSKIMKKEMLLWVQNHNWLDTLTAHISLVE